MNRIAVVIYSKLEGAGKSAVYRAMMFVDELRRGGDDVALVFDGAGTTALAEMLGDDRGHASLRALLLEGRQIITF
jgi:hypothetical protein